MIKEIDDLVNDSVTNELIDDPLKACTTESIMDDENIENNEVKEIVIDLRSLPIHNMEPSLVLKEGNETNDKQKDKPPKLKI